MDRVIEDGDTVTLGGMTLRALWTGGHTQGATMWMTTVREGGDTYSVAFRAAKFRTRGAQLFNNPRHPTVVADTQRTLQRLKELEPPDLFLHNHPQIRPASWTRLFLSTRGVLPAWTRKVGAVSWRASKPVSKKCSAKRRANGPLACIVRHVVNKEAAARGDTMVDPIRRTILKTGAAATVLAATRVFAEQTGQDGAAMSFYEKGPVRIRYEEVGSGFRCSSSPAGD